MYQAHGGAWGCRAGSSLASPRGLEVPSSLKLWSPGAFGHNQLACLPSRVLQHLEADGRRRARPWRRTVHHAGTRPHMPRPLHSPSAPATRSLGVLTRGPCRHPTAPRPSATRRPLLSPLFWNRECPHLCPSSEFFSWGAVRGEATTNSEQEQVPSPAFPAAFSAPGRQCHLSHDADRSVLITPENT